MSDFIALNQGKSEGEIENNGFFPNVSLYELRKSQNIDSTVTSERLKQAVIVAITRINQELFEYRLEAQALGFLTLASMKEDEINGINVLVHQYLYAVFTQTHAYLIEKYRDFDATEKGIKKSESVIQTANDLYRESRYAIRDILQISHSTFELI